MPHEWVQDFWPGRDSEVVILVGVVEVTVSTSSPHILFDPRFLVESPE